MLNSDFYKPLFRGFFIVIAATKTKPVYKKIFCALCLFSLFSSCQKEVDFQNGNTPGGGTQNDDYQPTSANSEWKMQSTHCR